MGEDDIIAHCAAKPTKFCKRGVHLAPLLVAVCLPRLVNWSPMETSVKGINHLVLAANDLDAIRKTYAGLGFTLTAPGQHPFGTGNTIIQLHGSYLELLAVTRPNDVVEPRPGEFSFSAFNRDYLERHEGFSMLVMDSADAAADIANWKSEGVQTYNPFEFSRKALMPSGDEVTVGFSLAFVSYPAAPWLGLFACQHYRPEYYSQPQYQAHENGARNLHDVWISGPGALQLEGYVRTITGSRQVEKRGGKIEIGTKAGTIVLAEPGVFLEAFGEIPPHSNDGPHLCGFTIACDATGRLPTEDLRTIGGRRILASDKCFGAAMAFLI